MLIFAGRRTGCVTRVVHRQRALLSRGLPWTLELGMRRGRSRGDDLNVAAFGPRTLPAMPANYDQRVARRILDNLRFGFLDSGGSSRPCGRLTLMRGGRIIVVRLVIPGRAGSAAGRAQRRSVNDDRAWPLLIRLGTIIRSGSVGMTPHSR